MLRVRVEIVPYGDESLAEEIAVLAICNDGTLHKTEGHYDVYLGANPYMSEHIGTFKLHKYGWYRNRLGLAARGLKLLQQRRNNGKALGDREPFGLQDAYVKQLERL